ncbi:MAG: galactonate dehydratase [Oscillospiraceae bacterium]|jgi:galactonate dehydratase|nr:galactonate dehydratase [Oscillospiraceae bacterium]
MKIKQLELFQVPPRWLFLKITTASGIEGWGEPILEGHADAVEACVKEFSEVLIGRNAGDIEDIFQVLYRGGFYRGGGILTSALSGIEQALWDIKGKFHNLPAYEFLGGAVRDKIKVYCGGDGDTPESAARAIKNRHAQGYKAIKMNAVRHYEWIDTYAKIDAVSARVAAMREAVGYDVDIAMDVHGRMHKGMARVLLAEMEQYRLLFIEEPVLTEHPEAFVELRKHGSTPLATGERNYTRWGYKDIITQGGIDIIQPDLSHAGGLLECKKIAAMAECYDVAVAPHCPLGPIALASCLQLDWCTHNAFIQEQSLNLQDYSTEGQLDYVLDRDTFAFKDGYVHRTEKPGLGITINEELVRERAKERFHWYTTQWRNTDGSVAEW